MLEPIMTNIFWFDAKTDLPTVEGDYLVAIEHNDIVPGPVGYITTMHFFEKSRTFFWEVRFRVHEKSTKISQKSMSILALLLLTYRCGCAMINMI
jgi:hypothetical protein